MWLGLGREWRVARANFLYPRLKRHLSLSLGRLFQVKALKSFSCTSTFQATEEHRNAHSLGLTVTVCLVLVGKDLELDAVGRQFQPYPSDAVLFGEDKSPRRSLPGRYRPAKMFDNIVQIFTTISFIVLILEGSFAVGEIGSCSKLPSDDVDNLDERSHPNSFVISQVCVIS